MSDFVLILPVILILANVAAYLAFAWDKRQAVLGGWRVSEQTLLMLALCGGWFGAKLAQTKFRHKTRKQPFANTLNTIGALYLALPLLIYLIDGDTFRALGDSFAGPGPDPAPQLPRRFGPGS